MSFSYPDARRDETCVDDYHSHKVTDHYRWLEDPDSKETKKFVDAQNAVTIPFLEKCPIRQKLHDRIKELWDYPKFGCPMKHGLHYFYYHNTGLQNQSVLYIQDSLEAEAREFLDPNKLSEEGTVAISGSAFSEDGRYFAYGLSDAGSDWITMRFRDTNTGCDLDDVLKNVKFSSMSWTHDHKGIFYNQYPEQDGKSDGTETTSNLDQKLYYHRLGTPQSEDVLCASWPGNPKWMTGAQVSHCGRYLICDIREGCDPVNRLYICDLKTIDYNISGFLPFVKVVDNFDAEYEYITNEGSVFTFKTNLNSPRYRLININFESFLPEDWVTLVEQHEHDVLEWAACVNNSKLVLCYLHDVKSTLHIHDLTSGKRLATLPLDIGSIVGYSGQKKDTEIFYQFVSFLTPGIIYRCCVTGDDFQPVVFRQIKLKDFDQSGFETKQVFYPSLDDPYTKIPMFIIHRKGIELDGSHPLLLYGYGGFNISITPTFSVSRLVFMNHLRGILAIPNIRGGGEYGETWHKAGMLANKQNVFSDFQSAAQYLIDNKYTSAQRIIINGGSNGGLLVAACANQRPDLFGCAIAQVGVMDMLRFHKFTIGHAWTTDFGCSDKKEEFNWLIKYSPLHNIKIPDDPEVQYPATLLLTGDHDDRVVPLHSLKFIAQLQNAFRQSKNQIKPLMIRVDTKSGHGAGKPTGKVIEELTDIYSFIAENIKLQWQH